MANGEFPSKIEVTTKGNSITTFVIGAYLIILTLNFVSFLFSNVGQPLARFVIELSNFAAAWAFPSLIIYAAWKIHEEGFYGPLAAFGVTALMLLFFPVLRISNIGFIGGLGVARIPGVGISLQPLINLVLSVVAIFGVFAVLKYLGKAVSGGAGLPQVREEVGNIFRRERKPLTPEEEARRAAIKPEPPGLPRGLGGILTAPFRWLAGRIGTGIEEDYATIYPQRRNPIQEYILPTLLPRSSISYILRQIYRTVLPRDERQVRSVIEDARAIESVVTQTAPMIQHITNPPAGAPINVNIMGNMLTQHINAMINPANRIRNIMSSGRSLFRRLLTLLEILAEERRFAQLNDGDPRLMAVRPELLQIIERARQRDFTIAFYGRFYEVLAGFFERLVHDNLVSPRISDRFDFAAISNMLRTNQRMWNRIIQPLGQIRNNIGPFRGLIEQLGRNSRAAMNSLQVLMNEARAALRLSQHITGESIPDMRRQLIGIMRPFQTMLQNARAAGPGTTLRMNTNDALAVQAALDSIERRKLPELAQRIRAFTDPGGAVMQWLQTTSNNPLIEVQVQQAVNNITALAGNLNAHLTSFENSLDSGFNIIKQSTVLRPVTVTLPNGVQQTQHLPPEIDPVLNVPLIWNHIRQLHPLLDSIENDIASIQTSIAAVVDRLFSTRPDVINQLRDQLVELQQFITQELPTLPPRAGP